MSAVRSTDKARPGSAALRRNRPEPVIRTVVRRRPDGTGISRVTLSPEFFGIEPNTAVMHQVVTAQLAASRSGTHSTRTRAEVAGGGAKPYKQKGTGRARQGTTRAPQWAGGGVAMGPKPRSYRQRTPKKMIRLALCSALSDRASEDRVALVDSWSFEVPRTKEAAEALGALEIYGKVLVVLESDDLDAAYSFRNLPDVHIIAGRELNAYDVLRHDWVVFTDTTLPGGLGSEEPYEPEPDTEAVDEQDLAEVVEEDVEPETAAEVGDTEGDAAGVVEEHVSEDVGRAARAEAPKEVFLGAMPVDDDDAQEPDAPPEEGDAG